MQKKYFVLFLPFSCPEPLRIFLSRRGSLTIQFLIGFVLILGFSMMFFMMTVTLAVSEIAQYITYSSARALFLSSDKELTQKANARAKYEALAGGPFKSLFRPNQGDKPLFEIANNLQGEDGGLGINELLWGRGEGQAQRPNLFYGVWTKFIPHALQIKPLWGSVEAEEEGFFETNIGSYLGREPSFEEVRQFNFARMKVIMIKHPQPYPDRSVVERSYIPNEDNGG